MGVTLALLGYFADYPLSLIYQSFIESLIVIFTLSIPMGLPKVPIRKMRLASTGDGNTILIEGSAPQDTLTFLNSPGCVLEVIRPLQGMNGCYVLIMNLPEKLKFLFRLGRRINPEILRPTSLT